MTAHETKVMKMWREKLNGGGSISSSENVSSPTPPPPPPAPNSNSFGGEKSFRRRVVDMSGTIWVQALAVFVVVAGLLLCLCPPFAARDSSDDDLNQSRVDPVRVFLWASISAVSFVVILHCSPTQPTPLNLELVQSE